MRDREVIEREMFRAREDLEQSVNELKHIVQEKVDVKARARVAIERGKDKAALALERGAEEAKQLAIRGREGALEAYDNLKDRPMLTGAIIGGLVATSVFLYIGFKNDWWSN